MCDQQRLRPACAYTQSDQSLCYSLEYSMNIKLLTEQHLEFLSLKGGYTGSSESIHVKMPHCWKSHVTVQMDNTIFIVSICSVVLRSRFLGDTCVPLPEFQRDICKFWGTHQFHPIFTCKIENSFPEISFHFYLHLSSISIVLAQEGVQITVKLFLNCRSSKFPSKYSISTLK